MAATHSKRRPHAGDLTGQRFGRWTVSHLVGISGRNKRWQCACDCGTLRVVSGNHLIGGRSQSCGCLRNDVSRESLRRLTTTHGLSVGKTSSLFTCWNAMMTRCYNPDSSSYVNYGGRGIFVVDRWHDVRNFVADMAPRPAGHSLDRIDNDGPYSPENCRWATPRQQQLNQRRSRRLTLNGVTMTMAEWVEATGISRSALKTRLALGWSVEQALTTPVVPGQYVMRPRRP